MQNRDAIRIKAKELSDKGEYKEAITQIENIIDKDPNDWRTLATYQDNAANEEPETYQVIEWSDKAIQSSLHILEKERTLDDWEQLVYCHRRVGTLYGSINQKPQARNYFYSTLDLYKTILDQYPAYTSRIEVVYSELQAMELPYSINQQFYAFANRIFTTTGSDPASLDWYYQFQQSFFNLHEAIILTPISPSNLLHRGLLQLLQLMELGVSKPDFPNAIVKHWLSHNQQQFKQCLQEIQKKNAPSLFRTIDEGQPLSVAVANILKTHEKEIETLKADKLSLENKVATLENESKELKALLSAQPKSSHYQGNFTTFKRDQKPLQDPNLVENRISRKRKRSSSLDY